MERRDGESAWTITDIAPRRSQLARRAPGGAHGERVLVANIDQVVIVFAAARPEPHPRMLDRFLVIAEANALHARIVINKSDQSSEAVIRARFVGQTAAGYPLHVTSALTGDGVDALRADIEHGVSAVTGPSGVGKSSLLNRLFPDLSLRTGAISESVNKGRHTTVGAVLLPLSTGGFIADTPGLREIGMWGLKASELRGCFPEFSEAATACRFADCSHRREPGCAVREAVGARQIDSDRYDSYLRLYEDTETNAPPTW
jgi:ribosome biogenesis GTPase